MESIENNLNGKILCPVIDFDLIVDTDFGLIRFIRENFQDERAFDLSILNRSDREILSLLANRINPNPLSIVSSSENIDDIDELYNSFMTQYKQNIIDRSISNKSIYTMVSLMFSNGYNLGINGTVCVKDEIEKSEILSHFQKSKIILNTDKNGVLNKDVYYVKDYRFFTKISIENMIKHKKVYMLPNQYNINYFEENDNELTSTNKLFFINNKIEKENTDEKP